MKKPFIFILLLSFSVVIVSVVSSLLLYSDIDETKESVKNKIKKTQEITYEKIDKDDPIINVYDVDENKKKKMNMEEYLYGVLSSEMPSTFDEEALKAQAVAARTYVIYKIENNIKSGHKGADICTNSSHCQAYTSYENLKNIKKISRAMDGIIRRRNLTESIGCKDKWNSCGFCCVEIT